MKKLAYYVLLLIIGAALFVFVLLRLGLIQPAAEASVIPADEAGWFTIASKPIWNKKACLWELTCYDNEINPVTTVTAICSPSNNVGLKMDFLDKGDKAYLVYPKSKIVGFLFVNNIKTAKEYRRDNMKIPSF